jgi:hypothetical protein
MATTSRTRPRRITLVLATLLVAAPAASAAAAGQEDGPQKPEQAQDMSIQEAWENARRDWNKLQDASGKAWRDAREEFAESWQRLQEMMAESEDETPPPPGAMPESEK